MTSAQVTGSAFFTYVRTDVSNAVWISLPGTNLFSGRTYNVAVNSSTIRLYINRTSGTGSETFTATRVVVIPVNDLRNGRKAAVDYTDYETVKAFYHLPD
ncbi:hypothetical protein EXU85_11510 [Spirosoma sp. KCTC 42546]|uniref:hypothetical protein n=1 Tax=Spirosoma sp. KCTC 42546 TaxID=2520506 RepID=UPI00115A5768|nr:hypothetical protein [Spirosoma sp. KCTC 42546]QDK79198.1 hypothetical protein EXU85_11510 [Spirosoma sp. KCTC 42546]